MTKTNMPLRATALLAVGVALAGCASDPAPYGPFALADLAPTRGNAAAGQVRFTQVGDKVRVTGEVTGLKPNAVHGFHVHEKGDCSSGDGLSAGGHFNPGGHPHGAHGAASSHAGDLPNLRADAQGKAVVFFETQALSVGSASNGIVGRGLVVHRDPDDLSSQPAGNAGPRVACAPIRLS